MALIMRYIDSMQRYMDSYGGEYHKLTSIRFNLLDNFKQLAF